MIEPGSNDTRRRKAECPHPPVARSTRARGRGRTLHHRELFALMLLVLGAVCVAGLAVGGRTGAAIALGALAAMVLLIFVAPLHDGGWFRAPPRGPRPSPRPRAPRRDGGCGSP